MTPQSDIPAAEVFAIIEEPTVQTGPIRLFLLKMMAPFGGQMILPGGTHPVVYEKATGKRVKGSSAASTMMIADRMMADLETMSAADFQARHLGF